jgi:radical SAM superfamily enzyme with C-terminal helix-hairpin-helix motif
MRLTAILEYPDSLTREQLGARLSKCGLTIIKVTFSTRGRRPPPASVVSEARELYASGVRQVEIARRLCVSQSSVSGWVNARDARS